MVSKIEKFVKFVQDIFTNFLITTVSKIENVANLVQGVFSNSTW